MAAAEFSKLADECSTFIASSFRIWNSSAEIPSPPIALFVLILPKIHLTLHSKLAGSRWVTTPLWLFASLRSFLYSSFMYSFYLFLISSASVRSILFLFFIVPILPWNVPFKSLIFFKRSLVFPFYCFPLFLCIAHLGKLSYLLLFLNLCLQVDISSFLTLPLVSLFSAIFKASSDWKHG